MAACSTGSNAAPNDAGADVDSGVPCLLCKDVEPFDLDASIGRKAYDEMDRCNGVECHSCGTGGLTFPLGNEAENVINVPSTENPSMVRVLPGDPLRSYLYLKVWCDGGIDGGCMPRNQTVYNPAIPELFFAWIEAGAPPP